MLIRNAELRDGRTVDVRIAGPSIAAVGALAPNDGEPALDARGGLLLPGLHDHHIHLNGLAARDASVPCGPPDVIDGADLAAALDRPGDGWIRGIGYHESVMGLPDARELDQIAPHRPVRIQHRSGRMWLLNTRAIDALLAVSRAPSGLETSGGRHTGRLFDADDWLRAALRSVPPDLAGVSRRLAVCGVTGITDMSPANDTAAAHHFADQSARGALLQQVTMAGTLVLSALSGTPIEIGPAKLHLHEAKFPEFDATVSFIVAAHSEGRAVAIHCVSEIELVFALAVLEAAGCQPGDRIEHVSVASPELVRRIRQLALHTCVQPHFIHERGDHYLTDVEPRHVPDLYRLASLDAAGIPMAGGSDAPFGNCDPWAAMAAAVSRRTLAGALIGSDEALTPERALELYLADPADLARQRTLKVGARADIVLLDRPWSQARHRLSASDVRMTIRSGRIIHDRIDEAPFERGSR